MIHNNFLTVTPVNITSQPRNVTVNGTELEKATFLVVAEGDLEDLTYQWKKGGINLTDIAGKLEGVNTPMLTVLGAQWADEGFYSCEVTNGAGDSETSDKAYLYPIGNCHDLL